MACRRAPCVLLVLVLAGCGEPSEPGRPPPGSSSGNVTTDPGSAGGMSTTDASTGTGTASSASGSGTGSGSGSGSSGGGQPYGPCVGLMCPGGRVCVESLQNPGFDMCTETCLTDADCELPGSGNAMPTCAPPEAGGDTICRLDCSSGEDCPTGTLCVGAWCWNG